MATGGGGGVSWVREGRAPAPLIPSAGTGPGMGHMTLAERPVRGVDTGGEARPLLQDCLRLPPFPPPSVPGLGQSTGEEGAKTDGWLFTCQSVITKGRQGAGLSRRAPQRR